MNLGYDGSGMLYITQFYDVCWYSLLNEIRRLSNSKTTDLLWPILLQDRTHSCHIQVHRMKGLPVSGNMSVLTTCRERWVENFRSFTHGAHMYMRWVPNKCLSSPATFQADSYGNRVLADYGRLRAPREQPVIDMLYATCIDEKRHA